MVASLSTGAGSSLFGRTAEQTVLRAGLDAARAGRGRLVFVAGEAGIGKTALVTALARDAEQEGARVLVLEDLHWADAASLDLLRALARAIAAEPVLILGTYREDELDRAHPLYALLPRFVRESDVARIVVPPLTAADVAALVRARYALPDADGQRLARSLYDRAEGNALFTTELLYALENNGSLRQTAGV